MAGEPDADAAQTAPALTAEQAAVLDRLDPALRGRRLRHVPDPRGHRQRQDRGLPQRHRAGRGAGREAIVLVPEISLTPQTIRRFRRRFARVAVLHSHLSDAERHRHWQSIASGEVQVVVGARSAVFAPTRRLGLIVIDEEHEGTFKQETTPRYHARDVAVKRAQLERVPDPARLGHPGAGDLAQRRAGPLRPAADAASASAPGRCPRSS